MVVVNGCCCGGREVSDGKEFTYIQGLALAWFCRN